MRTTITAIFAACVAVPTLAAADTPTHRADPAYRGDGRFKIAEVSADPRDGTDVIGVRRARFDQLEVIAANDDVALQRMEIRFENGRVLKPYFRGRLREGDRRLIDLPANAGPIESIVLDYGSRHRRFDDRTSARLKIYGLERGRYSDRRHDRRARYDRQDGRYYDDRYDDRFDGRYDDRYDDGRDDRYPRPPDTVR
jgi:hypothetical protein